VVNGYAEKRGPGFIGFVTGRERYIDDYLLYFLEKGLQQLVILGVGYDSRAYRLETLKGRVKIFEVDHPATQQVKRKKLIQIFGALPGHVVFVPIDFNRQTLEQRLLESGYNDSLKTLFIWQGVTYYLTPESVDGTLAFVAHHSGAGSAIIFDYMFTSLLDGTVKRGEVIRMRRTRRFTGEGLNFGVPEGTIEKFLRQRGFVQVKNVTAGDLKKIYFTGVNQNREVAAGYAIVSAVVNPAY
jgi:methyltransferase (TIGR00027 family)